MNFGSAYSKIYACFDFKKTAFVMQNFRNLGVVGMGVTIFEETPKGISLPDFTRFEPLCVQIRSRVFRVRELTFAFAICHRPSVCHRLSACLPVVCL